MTRYAPITLAAAGAVWIFDGIPGWLFFAGVWVVVARALVASIRDDR